ncbi:UNVERIFIED_CONTAM: hypothetical protein RMT77_010291 [Armadillidium vulgare]
MHPEEPKSRRESSEELHRERRPSYAYVNEIRRSGSSHEGSNPNITTGYHRSSSSSSTASSGKNLVKNKNSSNNRSQTEWNYSSRDSRYIPHHRRGNGLSSSSPSPSPEVPKKSPPKFFLGPPPSPGSSTGYHSPLRSSPSPSPSPEMPSTPTNNRVKSPHLLHPHYGVELHAGNLLSQSDKEGKINSAYDSYWHIPRASLWCRHNNCEDPDKQCPQCQAKDEISSNCSSINPPPTFTALDNYRPVKKRRSRCSCGAVTLATLISSAIILIIIAAFILYIEMVIKKNDYVPNPM